MNRKNKTVYLLFCIIFMATMIVGCGVPTISPTSDTQSVTTNAENTTKSATPATLQIVMFERWAGVGYDNFSIRTIEEKTNTKLEINAIGAEFESKLNILLASGDRPDIIQFLTNATELEYVSAGILVPINQYFDKAPNLKKFGEDGIWDNMTLNDGNIYAVPIKGSIVDNVPLYRKDWLDKFGLKVPETIEEYYTAAEALTNQDPDGNNKKDTYALGGHIYTSINMNIYSHILGAFGVMDSYMDINGQIAHGAIQPGMKDAMKFLNKMYRNKLIDPEFVTDNEARFKEKVQAGVIGTGTYRYMLVDTDNLNNYYAPFKEKNPNGEFVVGPLLKGPAEKNPGIASLTRRGWLRTGILKESKNVDAAIGLLDWLASDEGIMFVQYGVENEHYTIKDGVVKSMVNDDGMKELGITQMLLARENLIKHTSKAYQEAYDYAQSIAAPLVKDNLFIDDTSKENDLEIFTSTQYAKMITAESEAEVDRMFGEFVSEWNRRGGEELTKAYNEEYQRKKK